MTSAGALEAHADVANSKKTLRYRGRLEMSCDKAIFPDRKTCHMCIMICEGGASSRGGGRGSDFG